MTENEVLTALRRAARAFATTMPDVAEGKGRAYEAWVMLALANRLVTKGFVVDAVDGTGAPVRKLRLRKRPGPMPSDKTSATSPGHLVIWRDPFCRHELHLGMQHEGKSGALHEVDLSIIPAHSARGFRSTGGGPWADSICFAFELKAYGETAKLDLSIARALIGVAHDLDPDGGEMEVSVSRGGRSQRAVILGNRSARLYLVTSAKLYPETTKLLEWHGGATFTSLIPNVNEAPLDDMISDMANQHRCYWQCW